MPQSRFKTTTIFKFAAFSAFGYLSYLLYQKHKKKEQLRKEWKGKNIAKITDLSLSQILDLFAVSLKMEEIVIKNGTTNIASNKLLTTIFYEPSTRTSTSFQAAMLRLGGKVINISNVLKTSSVKKGESLEDTMKCLSCYSDIITIRHSQKGSPDRIIKSLNGVTPIVNAGDGSGEHPTQALLDLFTIFKYNKYNLNNLTITFIGDLKYGRTVHSLSVALGLFNNIKINFIAPNQLQIPQYIIDKITKLTTNKITIHKSEKLTNNILEETDVMYVTRIQKERFQSIDEYQKVKGCFVINNNILKRCKNDMIIMHPLPRVDEIASEVDDDPRAVYFKQMEYGMYVRMALLALILGVY